MPAVHCLSEIKVHCKDVYPYIRVVISGEELVRPASKEREKSTRKNDYSNACISQLAKVCGRELGLSVHQVSGTR